MKDFISDHKRLTIGIAIYIAVFIVSNFLSPWQIGEITISDLESDSANMVTDKVPVNIIFFGIYELCELLFYVSYTDSFDSGNSVMFFISACAIFTYMYFVKRIFINEDSDDFLPEKIALDFIYDNIFAYASSLIVYYLYKPVSTLVSHAFESEKIFFRAVTFIAIILLIIIPALPQFLQVLSYVMAISKITELLNYMDISLRCNIILKTIAVFAVAIILIVLLNIVINILLEKAEDLIGNFLKETFPAIFTLAICILKLFVGLIILAVILIVISFIVVKFF